MGTCVDFGNAQYGKSPRYSDTMARCCLIEKNENKVNVTWHTSTQNIQSGTPLIGYLLIPFDRQMLVESFVPLQLLELPASAFFFLQLHEKSINDVLLYPCTLQRQDGRIEVNKRNPPPFRSINVEQESAWHRTRPTTFDSICKVGLLHPSSLILLVYQLQPILFNKKKHGAQKKIMFTGPQTNTPQPLTTV